PPGALRPARAEAVERRVMCHVSPRSVAGSCVALCGVWCDVHDPVQVGVGRDRRGPDLRTLQGSVRVTLGAHEVLPDGGFPVFDAVPAGGVDHRVRGIRLERTMQRGPEHPPATAGNGDVVPQLATKSSTDSAGIEKRLIRTRGSDMAILQKTGAGGRAGPLDQYYSD